ncbi:MAG: hypothetical protein KDK70_16575, partial [Myxococcales bacterium]|nr:hypothetical protein [Myxococcales bacterium]
MSGRFEPVDAGGGLAPHAGPPGLGAAKAPPSAILTDPAAPVLPVPMAPPHPPAPALDAMMMRDTVDSVQGSIQLGTDGSLVAPQYTPTDVGEAVRPPVLSGPWLALLIAGAAALGVGLLLLVVLPSSDEPPSSAEPREEPAEPVASSPALAEDLRALARVNVADPERAPPYAQRHALLDQLRSSPEAARIDRRLNVALDLHQAGQSPAPCETYAGALDAVEADPDPYFGDALVATRAPEPSCAELDARREALLAQVLPPPPEPEPEPEARRRPR